MDPEFCMFNSFLSKIEQKTIKAALDRFDWVETMHAELNELKKGLEINSNTSKCLCHRFKMGFFLNKLYKEANVVQNKAHLIVKGYIEEEGIDYEDTFSPVVRLEFVHIFLEYVAHKHLEVF